MKYHVSFKRIGGCWHLETLNLYGRNTKKLRKQLLEVFTNLESFEPTKSHIRPTRIEETRTEVILEKLKRNAEGKDEL